MLIKAQQGELDVNSLEEKVYVQNKNKIYSIIYLQLGLPLSWLGLLILFWKS
jgi:hypothetical protein